MDRNIKDNRYVYGNGNESGIVDDPEDIFSDIPENQRLSELYSELLETVNLGNSQITSIMRQLNELEKEMEVYVIPKAGSEQEHVITLNNIDLTELSKKGKHPLTTDKQIEDAVKQAIYQKK